jgi:PEGA domain
MILSNIADRFRSPRLTGGILAALLLVSPGALAQGSGSDQAAADALYEEGKALLKAGNHAAGCAKFAASLAVSPAASTMINIARCHEQEGKLATAWADYTEALRLNGDTAGAQRRKELEELARQEIRALEPRLPRLRIGLAHPPPGVQVRSDDKVLPAAALGDALPEDPGPHVVRVGAPGYREETRSVTLAEGKTTVVELELERAAVQAAEVQPKARGWSRPTGIALVAVGAVGLGVGAVTGVLSLNKVSALRSGCPGYPHCPADDTIGQADLRSAKTLGNVSTAGFIAGGVLAATGVVLLVIGPGDQRKPESPGDRASSLAGSVRFSLGPGRFDLNGRF